MQRRLEYSPNNVEIFEKKHYLQLIMKHGLKNRFGSRNQLTESTKPQQHLAGTGAWLESKGECPEFVLFGHFAAKPNSPENEQLIIPRKFDGL